MYIQKILFELNDKRQKLAASYDDCTVTKIARSNKKTILGNECG